MDARALENRLAIAAGLWRKVVKEPLPKIPPGNPAEQIEQFELKVVEAVVAEATPETARTAAEATWDIVHDRPDGDPVKRRVAELHETLARMSAPELG
ncbi:MAG: hypothetical protein WD844_16115 [Thermoleophilaceae bacterium]